jgi:hypothetical protein
MFARSGSKYSPKIGRRNSRRSHIMYSRFDTISERFGENRSMRTMIRNVLKKSDPDFGMASGSSSDLWNDEVKFELACVIR